MFGSWHLGNDLVDLSDPRHMGKAADERFLRRVFSEEEQEVIRTASQPDRTLWLHWAGKEAAFKTISKLQGQPPIFHHGLFRVRLPFLNRTQPSSVAATLFGEVEYQGTVLPLRVEASGGILHALTWSPGTRIQPPSFSWGYRPIEGNSRGWQASLRDRFTDREWRCVSHHASALARLAAKEALAVALGVEPNSLEIGCGEGMPGRRIPQVFLEGVEADMDLSLSHHGRLLAWAFLNP